MFSALFAPEHNHFLWLFGALGALGADSRRHAVTTSNFGSDPLRAAPMRPGAPGGGGSSAAPEPSGGTSSGSAGTGRVQTENLAPPPAKRR
jgi:hypothetical protein